MTSKDDNEAELAAVAAYLGDPEWPCCPKCLNLTHMRSVEDNGLPMEFIPGTFYQRAKLDSPAKGSPDIIGDREGDCFHCGHRYLFRNSLWLTGGKLSDSARQESEERYQQ